MAKSKAARRRARQRKASKKNVIAVVQNPVRKPGVSYSKYPQNVVSLDKWNALCGLCCPWTEHCRNARLPTGAHNTNTFYSISNAYITSDGNGNAMVAVCPVAHQQFSNATSIVSGAVATSAYSDSTFYNAILNTNIGAGYRIVSAGIRVISTLSPMNASGYCFIDRMEGQATLQAGTQLLGPHCANSFMLPIHDLDVSAIFQIEGMVLSPIGNSVTAGTGWNISDTFFISFAGLPASTSSAVVQCAVQYEWLPNYANSYGEFINAPTAHPLTVAEFDLVDKARNKLNKVVPTKDFQTIAEEALREVVRTGGEKFGGMIRDRIGAALMMP